MFLTASSLAAAQRALAPEDVVSLWRVSDPQISPDGSRVAFVLTAPDAEGRPQASLSLAQAEGAAPRELKTPGRAVAPRWFPDGRSLAFVAAGSTAGSGERDLRVPVTQAHELYAALRHYGVACRLVVYPREEHSFREPAHQVDLMRRGLEWFREHDAR